MTPHSTGDDTAASPTRRIGPQRPDGASTSEWPSPTPPQPGWDANGETAPTSTAGHPGPARTAALPPSAPPPPTPPAEVGGGRRPGLPLRTYVAIALTAALGAGVVVVPSQIGDDAADTAAVQAQPASNQADEPAADDGASSAQDPAAVVPLPGANSGSQIATIAERLLPSVMLIEVATTNGGQGSGSGVVLDTSGRVLTNAHVVEDAADLTVITPNRQELDAEIIALDVATDIAVLQVDTADLPVPDYADGEPSVGETAIAIGSPFGLSGTVTSGIVSGVGRSLNAGDNVLFDLIQTDAAINPGNSGGALVNSAGEVIGINTAILSRSGANDGVGFAIPTVTALSVAADLIEFGEVRAGFLGVQGTNLDAEVARLYEETTDGGALIDDVVDGSAADDAGIEEGDIVIAVDGEQVTSMFDLASIVRNREPNETVSITIVRDGTTIDLDVTLGTRDE